MSSNSFWWWRRSSRVVRAALCGGGATLFAGVVAGQNLLHAQNQTVSYSQERDRVDNVSSSALYSTQRTTTWGNNKKQSLGVVAAVDSNSYNANPVIEDTFSVVHLTDEVPDARLRHANTNFQEELLVGVYDGHTGTGTSHFARAELFDFLLFLYEQDSFAWAPDTTTTAEHEDVETRLTAPLKRGMSGEWGALAYESGASRRMLQRFTVPYYLEQAFLLADYAHLNVALAEDVSRGQSGACAIVVHVDAKEGLLTVANAGDCMAVVGHRLPSSSSSSSSFVGNESGKVHFAGGMDPTEGHSHQAIDLNVEHQIDSDPRERRRLLDQHPSESDIIRRDRIKGRLQPTRGLGDGSYKHKHYYFSKGGKFRERYPDHAWMPPYVSSQPDVSQYRLRQGDEFIVVSTDGLFQDLNSQQVVDYVGEFMDRVPHKMGGVAGCNSSSSSSSSSTKKGWFSSKQWWPFGSKRSSEEHDHPNAASFLISKSLLHASESAFGKQTSEAQSLSHVYHLAPKDKARRNVHDDNTVIVVWIDQDALRRRDESASSSSVSSSSSSGIVSTRAPVAGLALPSSLEACNGTDTSPLHIPQTLRRFAKGAHDAAMQGSSSS